MSMMSGGPTVNLHGDATGVVNAATQANNALASLTNTVNQNWWGLQNLGMAFSALPAAMGAAATMAVKSAIEWQDAMFGIERVTGESGEALAAIEEDILAVARAVPLATTELASLAAQGAQLGIAEESLGEFAKTMGILISATDLSERNVADFARVANVMGVPEEQFDRFATTLLEVGRNTAATESEILNISKRMSGAASVAGLTTDELLGLGAAIISLGPRAEAGATAMNKTIADMTRAISSGGDELQVFAHVAGQSTDEFSAAFREDAAGAVAAFMTGLARLEGGGEAAYTVLDQLGITEARQASALLQLAQGTLAVGDEQRDLNTILGASANYWETSNALEEIAAARARTITGQLQLLKNALFEFGAVIGKVMIGPLGFMIQRIMDFLAGVQALPLPLKVLMGALVLITTGISALLAAVFLIGPRLLIAADAFKKLKADAYGATAALATTQAAMTATGNAATTMGAKAVVGGAGLNAAGGAGAGVAATNTGVAAGQAAGGLATMAKWGSRLAKVGGVLTLALTGLTIVTTVLGHRTRKAAEEAEKALGPNEDLVSIMRQQGAIVGPASEQWLYAQENYQAAAAAAQALGFNLLTLNAIITGQASPAQMDELVQTIRNGGEEGRAFGQQVLNLATIFDASAQASNVTTQSVSDFSLAEQEAAEATEAATEALQEQYDLLSSVAQAHLDLADAVVAQRDAASDLASAQEEYNNALREAENPMLAVRRAELELAQARFDEADAQRDLADKEKDLAEARLNAANRVRDAEHDLADARDKQIDTTEKIADLEERVAELRAGPSADEMRDATNALRDAELRLLRAHQSVEDAEWNLQHLREEGASARDIEDAELAIAEARAETANAEDEVIDTTEELNSLRDGTAHAEELADAERDLAGAYRDLERDGRNVQKAEADLAEARQRQAADTDYQEAQSALVDAQLAVQDAVLATRDAELELEAVRGGRAQRDLADAAAAVEASLIRMAQANAEVRQQQALANGETWDAGDAAHALADELSALLGLAPDETTRQNLQNYIDTLYAAPDVPDDPSAGNAGPTLPDMLENLGLPPLSDVSSYLDELNSLIEGAQPKEDKSMWEQLFGDMGGGIGVGASVGGLIGLAFGMPFVGAAIGAVIGGLTEKFWPEISTFFIGVWDMLARNLPNWFGNVLNFFTGLPGTIGRALGSLGSTISDAFGAAVEGIWNFIQTAGSTLATFFSELPFKIGYQIGFLLGTIVRGFIAIGTGIWNTLVEWGPKILGFFISLPGEIAGFLISLPGTIAGLFTDAVSWAFDAVQTHGMDILNWFINLPGNILNAIINLGGTLFNAFWQIGADVFDGFNTTATTFWNWFRDLPDTIWNFISGLPGQVAGWFADIGRGMWEGFRDAIFGSPHTKIEYTLWDIEATMIQTVASLRDNVKKMNQMELDPFAGTEDAIANIATGIEGVQQLAKGGGIDLLGGFLSDMNGARMDFSMSNAAIPGAATGNVTYNETLQLEAITTADPAEIVNQYVWQKRVRLRGGVNA